MLSVGDRVIYKGVIGEVVDHKGSPVKGHYPIMFLHHWEHSGAADKPWWITEVNLLLWNPHPFNDYNLR